MDSQNIQNLSCEGGISLAALSSVGGEQRLASDVSCAFGCFWLLGWWPRGHLCHQVLQALKETDPWDDEDIDEILAAADASGDGELQIEDLPYGMFLSTCSMQMLLFACGILRAR